MRKLCILLIVAVCLVGVATIMGSLLFAIEYVSANAPMFMKWTGLAALVLIVSWMFCEAFDWFKI